MATCPYCKKDGIDSRGLVPHIRMSGDEIHGPKGSTPDGTEETLRSTADENEINMKDVTFVSFQNASVDEPDPPAETKTETESHACLACGGDLHELSEGEPIEINGQVIGYADAEDDFICLECGEIHTK